MELHDLSTELLLCIFKYMDIADLCHLKQTCKRFNNVIKKWDHVLLWQYCPLVTNQRNPEFLAKCMFKLSTLEKIRISKNWLVGRYLEKSLLFVSTKYLPRLYVDDKLLWFSRGPKVHCYERTKNKGNRHLNIEKPKAVIQGGSNADVGSFQVKNNLLVSGQRDGSIWMVDMKAGKTVFNVSDCHESDIITVDYSDSADILATGSRDSSFKLWNVDRNTEDILIETKHQRTRDRVLKVSMLQGTSQLAVGTSGSSYINTLLIYDLESMTIVGEFPSTNYGMGVLDCRWENPNLIWSCGYDSRLRRWDLRTGSCVQSFQDCHGTTLYCLDYDYVNTVMTGTAMHGRVILWDVRQSRVVQLFFMEACRSIRHSRSSPVYSLSFDSEFLFTATDQNLNVMNFYVHRGPVNDYSTCLY